MTPSAASQTKSIYRADIDGLRAIAVTSVVLFHMGAFPFRGGFIGVDVFFVISGYLIGGIIQRSVSEHRFNVFEFYARRARRILPALLVVVAATLVAGWFLLNAAEFRSVGATSMSALLATSNFSFWSHQDYFNPDSRQSPLLMTWSLGVEEQFYVLFPLVLIGAMKLRRVGALTALAIGSALSFLFALWTTAAHPVSAFYLLPSRAWELGAGATLAALEIRQKTSPATGWNRPAPALRKAAGWAGLALIVASIALIGPETPFPGLAALGPIAGTAMLIWSEPSFVNRRLLSASPVVFVGQISYSWYLWHWPLMSFVRIASVTEPPVWLMGVVAVISFGCAILSWRFVEQPLRHGVAPPVKTLAVYACVLAAFIAVAGGVKISGGAPQRLTAQANSVLTHANAGEDGCLALWEERSPRTGGNCASVVKGQTNIALVGDSHAAALRPGLLALTSAHHWGLSVFTKSGCGPLLGVDIRNAHIPAFASACRAFMQTSFDQIAKNADITDVYIAGYWSSYSDLGASTFKTALTRSIDSLKAAGKHVVLIGDVPEWAFDPASFELAKDIPARGALARLLWMEEGSPFPATGVSGLTAPTREVSTAEVRDIAVRESVSWFNLKDQLCRSASCLFEKDGTALFMDRHHLTAQGSRFALERFIQPDTPLQLQ